MKTLKVGDEVYNNRYTQNSNSHLIIKKITDKSGAPMAESTSPTDLITYEIDGISICCSTAGTLGKR